MPSPARSSLPPTGPGEEGRVIPLRAVDRVPPQGDSREGLRVTDPQEHLARYIQGRFLAEGQTLNDAETATAFRVTLEAVQHIHDAALAQGVIDVSQHGTLSAWLDGLRLAPDGLSRRE